jgi:hypothetical protein
MKLYPCLQPPGARAEKAFPVEGIFATLFREIRRRKEAAMVRGLETGLTGGESGSAKMEWGL